MSAPILQPRHDFSAAEIEDLEDRLYAFNSAATGRGDGLGLGFTILGEDGALIGAVAGYTWAGMSELRQVWVEEGRRGRGLGRALVEAAVAEAAARGCDRVFVMSYLFQAPGLYERCGFRRVAQIEGWPPGHSHVVLRRDLAAAGDRSP